MKNYILLLFLGLTGILNAQEIKLKVDYVQQDKTEWCSVAAAKCVLDYYGKKLPNGNPISQCYIMEYVMNKKFGDMIWGCCSPDPPGSSHICNKPVDLGVFNEKASVKDILMHFGDLPCKKPEDFNILDFPNIQNNINLNRLMVAQWNYFNPPFGGPVAHTLVIHGVEVSSSTVYYMDPAPPPQPPNTVGGGLLNLPWWFFNNNTFNGNAEEPKHMWDGTLVLTECSSGRGDLPCHCYNGEKDGDEQGVDCGGLCEPCAPPDCFNCLKSPDEQEIDCGGENCPPCEDVSVERTITNSAQLRKEVAAFNKITASGNVVVQTGKKVRFITKEEGAVILRPGFKAEKGCTFTTQRLEDLSGFGRICGTICGKWWVPSSCLPNGDGLYIHDLQYANKIVYDIYDPYGQRIFHKEKDISHNGSVFLCYIPINTTNITYTIILDSYHCDSSIRRYGREFTAIGYTGGKSSDDDPDDPETPAPPFSPPANNITLPNENPAPSFVIIPNPNSGTFQIEINFPLSHISNLKILNPLGAIVYETQNLTSNTIQLPNFASGQHFVMVMLKDGTVLTQKMMLQR